MVCSKARLSLAVPEHVTVLSWMVMDLAVTKSGADISRPVLFYRLNNLRAEGVIHGKQIGSGKGNWVWWGEGITSE